MEGEGGIEAATRKGKSERGKDLVAVDACLPMRDSASAHARRGRAGIGRIWCRSFFPPEA